MPKTNSLHKTEKSDRCGFSDCLLLPISGEKFCWDHLPDRDGYRLRLTESINRGDDLSGFNLQKVDLSGMRLEKTKLAGANLSQANMTSSHLFDAMLEGADMVGTQMVGCDLTHCNMAHADLTKARIVNSRLWNTDLSGANLTECDLTDSDLWDTRLYRVRMWHTVLRNVKSLTRKNFIKNPRSLYGPAKINEAGLLSAEESYRDLKGYFLSNGMYNDASWAAFNEKAMERLIFRKNGNLNYIPSMVMNILCGYGEKPYRIVLSALAAILLFAFLYASFHMVENTVAPGSPLGWSDYIYYSTITFTTVGYGDFIPRPFAPFRLLAACEAFLGVFLTGLFIFTLARKYSAR